MKGRALTDGQKRALIERIYAAWIALPHQRLGQLLDNALHSANVLDVFSVEDDALAEAVERFVQAHTKP